MKGGQAAGFQGPQAPFCWDPGQVESLPDGQAAQSSGAAPDPPGQPVARFNSV